VPTIPVDGHLPAAIIMFGTLKGRVPAHVTLSSTIDQEGCMDLKPLGDRVIVEVLDEEETTFSGIVLPDTAKEKPQRGKVLAVGPGKYEDGKLVPLDVKKGDEVIFSKYGGTEVKVSGDEYLILRESDILAKVATSKVAAKA
jgi:chaperonin GroES